ncbi:MAG TPA: PAS domain S-box protein [Candidatus Acidoferrales bacterium]|nr:PAS domain S-box protein [Candidatus Acidoferrales bacterium]
MRVPSPNNIQMGMRRIERREWLLWSSAILVTLLLTLGMISFSIPTLREFTGDFDTLHLNMAVRGLVGLVLLFDVYTIYQQVQIYRIRHQLVQREQLFRLISENAADMITVVEPDGQRLYSSPAYERVLGYGPEELQNTSAFEQVHPDDLSLVQEAAAEARNGGVGRTIQYRMHHKDGSWRTIESRASAISNAQGVVSNLVIVNRDVSERRQLEEQFRQAQKMEAVGRLSGGVAHDFNNLLGVIIGYAEFLQERMDQENALRGSVDEILKAGKRAASLTRQLLAFSRQQVLDPKVLDLNAVVADIEKMLRRLISEDIELTTYLNSDLGRVKADQGQLEQVLMNLAVNAKDAMPHGGGLVIQTENMMMDQKFVRRYPYPVQPGPYVCLTVTDTGIGMDAETKARAFEPFFTTKEKGKGTGLGLSTVYGVVKQSGGYIDIYSSPGAGTTFKIYLPRVDEAIKSETQSATPATAFDGNETILLAEDETSLRTLTRSTLELCGYKVLEAKDGVEALEISERHTGPIDLLLTDIVMPGMGGRALAQELTRRRPEVRLVYMSGYTGQAVGAQGPVEPGSVFLAKPFTRETLTRKLREALGRPAVTQTK